MRKYLDENFMLDFISDTKKAVIYSAEKSYKEKAEAVNVPIRKRMILILHLEIFRICTKRMRLISIRPE